MIRTDLLVIGGSAGGILTATMARKAYGDDVDITLIHETRTVMVPCGIPYIYGTLRDLKKNIIPDSGLITARINLIIDRALRINRKQKTVDTRENSSIEYKKLVIATPAPCPMRSRSTSN